MLVNHKSCIFENSITFEVFITQLNYYFIQSLIAKSVY